MVLYYFNLIFIIMDKVKFLQSIKEALDEAGLSVNDLVEYYNSIKKANPQKLDLEVMYEGMVRSSIILEGKKPLGVVLHNHLVLLHDSPEQMNWLEAMDYCLNIEFDGKPCSAYSIEFWLGMQADELNKLDDTLEKLGGTPLGTKKRWSTSLYSLNTAKVFGRESRDTAFKDDICYKESEQKYFVRPVLPL